MAKDVYTITTILPLQENLANDVGAASFALETALRFCGIDTRARRGRIDVSSATRRRFDSGSTRFVVCLIAILCPMNAWQRSRAYSS